MENGKIIKLGDICTTNASSYSSQDKWPFINYLDTGNITENRIDIIQRLNILTDTIPSRAKRKVRLGDIIYSTVRPNQRHYGFIEALLPNMLVSTGFTTISINPNLADPKYIYYRLTQDDIISRLQTIAEQSVSAYPSLKPSDLENIELLLPPLTRQKKVSKVLSTIDDKIAINRRINDNLAA